MTQPIPIEEERIAELNDAPIRNDADYVLYWMQAAQRAEHNEALELAVWHANRLNKRLLVGFALDDTFPGTSARHKSFLIDGLADIESTLHQRGIKFVVHLGPIPDLALKWSQDACLAITDVGYLRYQRTWRDTVADDAPCRVIAVETNLCIPVETVSDKAEFAARTIRPKIHRQLDRFLVELPRLELVKHSLNLSITGEDLSKPDALLDKLKVNTSIAPVPFFKGGTTAAKQLLDTFWADKFKHYSAHRNQPQTDDTSHMSKYLRFGQISPVWLTMQGKANRTGSSEDRDDFIEELVVRRELAYNFCWFTPDYDKYSCIPDWAKRTLDEHRDDPRDPQYTAKQLEDADTYDPYWNAAQREMRYTGYMHNYMRMYWGKKIMEWSATPELAFETMLDLNNKYHLDGRDPNSYVGVAWCFGIHDRGWTERPILGKTRYMNANGLKRKADPDAYVRKVDRLVALAKGEEPAEPVADSLFA
ncbi:MAG: deoxyribodipyrimidine photo-lyase [Planctomycetota bacterium]